MPPLSYPLSRSGQTTRLDRSRSGRGRLVILFDGRTLRRRHTRATSTSNVRGDSALLPCGTRFIARELVSGTGSVSSFATLAGNLADLLSIHRRKTSRTTDLRARLRYLSLRGLRSFRGGRGAGGIEQGIHDCNSSIDA